MSLAVAIQMDPIEAININGDSHLRPGARGADARPRPVSLPAARPDPARTAGVYAHAQPLRGAAREGQPRHPGRRRDARPRHARRRADAPGPALRHGLHHRDAPARARPSQDAGRQRPGPGAQRAGKAVRHAFPRADAADADHVATGARSTRSAREHKDIIVKPLFGNGGAGVFRVSAGRREPQLRCWRCSPSSTASRSSCSATCPRCAQGDKRIILVDGERGRRDQPRAGGGRGALQPACRRQGRRSRR